jgi:Na+/melibiose symporter-like transporter
MSTAGGTPTDRSEHLPTQTKILFGLGMYADALFGIARMLFLMIFYTDLYRLGSVWVSAANMVGTLWDAITDPIMGLISDKTRTRLGRRRPYILFAAFGYPLAFILLWTAPQGMPVISTFAYIALVNVLFTTMLTIAGTPYGALTAELTMDYHERTSLYTYRQALFHIGAVTGSFMVLLVGWFGGGIQGHRKSAALFALVACAGWLAAFFSVREREEFQKRASTVNVRLMLEVFRNRGFVVILITHVIMWAGVLMSNAMLSYVVRYWYGDMKMLSYGYTTWMISSVLSLPLWRMYGNYVDKKYAFSTSLVAIAVVNALSFVMIAPGHPYLLLVWAVLVGAFNAGGPVYAGSMIADAIDSDELVTGMRREGVYSGVFTFSMKLANAIGMMLVGVGLKLVGYVPGGVVQSPEVVRMMRLVYVLPAITSFAAALYVLRYPLVRARMAEIRQALDSRVAASIEPSAQPD